MADYLQYRVVEMGAVGSKLWQVERCHRDGWHVVAWFPSSGEADRYVAVRVGLVEEARRG